MGRRNKREYFPDHKRLVRQVVWSLLIVLMRPSLILAAY